MEEVRCNIRQKTYAKHKAGRYDETHATCSKCGLETKSFGSGVVSIKRCLALLRKNCPNKERNFYIPITKNLEAINVTGFHEHTTNSKFNSLSGGKQEIWYETFVKASSYAKQNPEFIVKRSDKGSGFVCIKKLPRTGCE